MDDDYDYDYDDVDFDRLEYEGEHETVFEEINEDLDRDLFGFRDESLDEFEDDYRDDDLFDDDGGLRDDPVLARQIAAEQRDMDFGIPGITMPLQAEMLLGQASPLWPGQIYPGYNWGGGDDDTDFLGDDGIVHVLSPYYLGPIYWNDNLSLAEWQLLYARNYHCGIDPITYRPYNVVAPYYWCFDYTPAEWDALYAANTRGGGYVRPIQHHQPLGQEQGPQATASLTYNGRPLTPTQLKVRHFLDAHPVMTGLGKLLIYGFIFGRAIILLYQFARWLFQ